MAENVKINVEMVGLTDLKRQFKEIQQAMTEAGKAGDQELFNKLKVQAAQIKDQMGDLRTEMAALEPDAMIKNFAALGSAIVAAFSLGSEVAQMFGVDQKTAEEATKSAMMAVQALQAVEVIRATLVEKKTLQAIAAGTKELLIKNGLTAATAAQAVTTGTATVAQWALNVAMNANPIGLILVALTALVGILYLFISSSQEAAVAQAKFNATFKETTKIVEENSQATEANIAIMKARGASTEDIINAEIEAIKREQKVWEDFYLANKDNYKNFTDEQKQSWMDMAKTHKKNREDITKLETQAQVNQINLTQKAKDLQIQNMADGYARDIAMSKAKWDKELEIAGTNSALIGAIMEAMNKDIATINRKYWLDGIKSKNEIDAMYRENNVKMMKDGFDKEKVEIDNNYKKQRADLEYRLKSDTNLTSEQRKKLREIIKSLGEQQLNEEKELEEKYRKVKEDNLKKIKQALETAQENEISSVNDKYDELVKLAEDNSELIIQLNKKRAKEIEKINNKYAQEAAEKELKIKLLNDQIGFNNKISSLQKSGELEKSILRQTQEFELSQLEERKAFLMQNAEENKEAILQIQLDIQAKQKEINDTIEQEERDRIDKMIGYATEAIDGISLLGSQISSIISTMYQNSKIDSDNYYNSEYESLNKLYKNKQISEDEYNKRKDKIDEEKAKKEKELKIKKAKQDKAAAIFNATISLAEAVVAASTAGPGIGLILAILTAAFDAAYLATVISTPLPTFAKGGLIEKGTTGTADDVPILASRGEFVINAQATSQNRGLLESINGGGGSIEHSLNRIVEKINTTKIVNNVQDTSKVQARVKKIKNTAYLQ